MKKNTLIPIAIMLAIIGAAAVYKLWPRTVPWDECSEVYRRYADTPGVNAAYVKDYRVNDTLILSATILEAKDSTAWNTLYSDFKLTMHYNPINNQHIEKGKDALEIFLFKPNNDVSVASHRDRYICIFEIDDSLTRDNIFYTLVNKAVISLTQNTNFKDNEKDI